MPVTDRTSEVTTIKCCRGLTALAHGVYVLPTKLPDVKLFYSYPGTLSVFYVYFCPNNQGAFLSI